MLLPEAFAMRNHFTTKVPFCYIEQDLANVTAGGSEATAAGEKGAGLISPGSFEV